MFTLSDAVRARNCSGYTRRDFLRVGGLGLGGLTLAGLLAAKARAGDAGRFIKDKAVVLLFLQGGPPHIELFDPKMTAPEEIRSITGEVQTGLPGITFGGTFPELGKLAEQDRRGPLVRVQQRRPPELRVRGRRRATPSGRRWAPVRPRSARPRAKTGIPSNIVIKPEAVQPGLKLGQNFETRCSQGTAHGRPAGRHLRRLRPQRRRRTQAGHGTEAAARALRRPPGTADAARLVPAPGRIHRGAGRGRRLSAAGLRRDRPRQRRRRSICPRKTRKRWNATTQASSSKWKS